MLFKTLNYVYKAMEFWSVLIIRANTSGLECLQPLFNLVCPLLSPSPYSPPTLYRLVHFFNIKEKIIVEHILIWEVIPAGISLYTHV